MPNPTDTTSPVYIDVETGTIITSPLYAVDPALLGDSELSDSEIIALAKTHGRQIA